MPFLEYFSDPAHAVGSVSGRVVEREIPRSKRYFCPDCGKEFSHDADVADHVIMEHPIPQPSVLFGGRRVTQKWIIRQPPDTSALKFANTTEVRLQTDGGPLRLVSPDDVREVLGRTRDGLLELHLRNRVATRRIDIRVLVPREEEMCHIEEEFVKHLAQAKVTVSDVRAFDEALRAGEAALDYASGLADYVYGVLAKDRAGQTTLPHTVFSDKLKQSLGVVRDFIRDRPLAAVVAGCIRFNLNDFRSEWTPCGAPMLDRAFLTFRQRAVRTESQINLSLGGTGTLRPFCPVDHVTSAILDAAGERDLALSTLRDMMMRQRTLSDEDRVKIQVLLAGCGANMEQEDILEILDDPVFGVWAKEVFANG